MSYNLPARTLVSQSDQALIPKPNIPRSIFRNTWNRKTSFPVAQLTPILVQEMLPGDHVTYDVALYMRLSTLIFPLMDMQRVDTHFFFVPNRLVWDNWKKFMGERASPGSSIDYSIPQIESILGGAPTGSLFDHFGIPGAGQIAPAQKSKTSALPFRMYNLIWNEWYRAEQIQNSVAVPMGDGPDNPSDYGMQQRNKSHDYFTTLATSPQGLANAAMVPLQGGAPLTGLGAANQAFTTGPSPTVYQPLGNAVQYPFYKGPLDATGAGNQFYVAGLSSTGYPLVQAVLDGIQGFSIASLRQTWALQQFLEAENRGGFRYIEQIKQQFGVTVPDYRLQRPEYIGGGSSPLNITPIAQTVPTEDQALATLGATGTIAGRHHASYACQEHGYVIGLLSIKTELSYQQGAHKHWHRLTRLNFYTPALADLPDQAVTYKEIYYDGDVTGPDSQVFGYQERWQEYRTVYSEVTGLMRSRATGTIDAWHLAQNFLNAPGLGTAFIVDSPPMDRVLAAAETAFQQQYIADINFKRTIVRAIPTFGIPATMGRF